MAATPMTPGRLPALRGDDDPGLPGPGERQRRSFHASFPGASSDGSKVFFETGEPLVSADTDSSYDIYQRSAGTTTLVSEGQINGNGGFSAASRGPPATARGSSSTPPSRWSAATPTAPRTSTSARRGRPPRSPRARSTATAPFTPSSTAPRPTVRRSSSTPPSRLSAAIPTAPMTSTSAPGGDDPSPRARSTATAPSTPSSAGASSDGSSVFFSHRRAAGQRRHRQRL